MEKKRENIIDLLKKREVLKQELKEISKKIKNINCNNYQKKEDNKQYCEYCSKNINKYQFEKHKLSRIHILNEKLKQHENK